MLIKVSINLINLLCSVESDLWIYIIYIIHVLSYFAKTISVFNICCYNGNIYAPSPLACLFALFFPLRTCFSLFRSFAFITRKAWLRYNSVETFAPDRLIYTITNFKIKTVRLLNVSTIILLRNNEYLKILLVVSSKFHIRAQNSLDNFNLNINQLYHCIINCRVHLIIYSIQFNISLWKLSYWLPIIYMHDWFWLM